MDSVAPAALVAAVGLSLNAEIFVEGLKAGLLTFGGAYTVVPFIQQSAVDAHGWLTVDEFVDGLALSGVLPAPLIIFSTFVGYLAGGLSGALLMTLGIFLPAFVFPIFLHRRLVAVADNRRIRPLLLGITAGVIGLIAAVAVDVVETSVVDVPTALLALGAFLVLNRYHGKLTVLYVATARRADQGYREDSRRVSAPRRRYVEGPVGDLLSRDLDAQRKILGVTGAGPQYGRHRGDSTHDYRPRSAVHCAAFLDH